MIPALIIRKELVVAWFIDAAGVSRSSDRMTVTAWPPARTYTLHPQERTPAYLALAGTVILVRPLEGKPGLAEFAGHPAKPALEAKILLAMKIKPKGTKR